MAPGRKLSHLGRGGEARMVDVSAKATSERVAVAEGRVTMAAKTLDLVLAGNAKKGDSDLSRQIRWARPASA